MNLRSMCQRGHHLQKNSINYKAATHLYSVHGISTLLEDCGSKTLLSFRQLSTLSWRCRDKTKYKDHTLIWIDKRDERYLYMYWVVLARTGQECSVSKDTFQINNLQTCTRHGAKIKSQTLPTQHRPQHNSYAIKSYAIIATLSYSSPHDAVPALSPSPTITASTIS